MMESTYICVPSKDLPPGECLIEKALVLDKSEWNRIRNHMQYLYKDAEYAEKQRKERQKIKEKSKFLARDWKDTLANKREKRLQENKARLEAIEKRRNEIQQAFRKEQAEEKRKYLEECEKHLRYNKDNIKTLNKALQFCEVLRTREQQIKFDKKLKENEEKLERAYAEKCKKDAEEFEREKLREKQKDIEKKMRCKEDLLTQIKEKDDEKEEEEKEKVMERADLDAMKGELDIVEQCEKGLKAKRREKLLKDMEEYIAAESAYKAAKKREEELKDKLIDIYDKAKRRMTKMQKEREKYLKDMAIQTREKVASYIAGQLKQKEDDEDARIRKAIAEREAEFKRQQAEKEAHQKHLLEENIQVYEQYLAKEKERKKEEEDLKKWEMMQRFKQNEANKDFFRQKEEKRLKDIKVLRDSCDQQVKEKEELLRSLKEEDIAGANLEKLLYGAEDELFNKYAEELIEGCKKKGLRVDPILRAMADYKKRNGLDRKPRIPPHLKTNIKIDATPEKRHDWGECQPKEGAGIL